MTEETVVHRMSRVEKQEQTRRALLDAASQVFADNGIEAATVEEITSRAGFSRGAFYSNFATKDDLCLALVERLTGRALEQTQAALATSATDGTGLADTILAVLDQGLLPGDDILLETELELYALRNPDFRPHYLAAQRASQETFSAILAAALQRLGLRLTESDDEAFELLASAFLHVRRQAVLAGDPDHGEHRVRTILTTLLTALTAPA